MPISFIFFVPASSQYDLASASSTESPKIHRRLDLPKVDPPVREHSDALLLVQGEAALLTKKMSKEVVASIGRQHIQALLLQLRKGCHFGDQETRQGLAFVLASAAHEKSQPAPGGLFQVGVGLLDGRDDLLIALWPSGAVMSLTVRCASEAASRHLGFSRHRGSPFQQAGR